MKKLKVTIREKEKKINSFNLYNFRDEVVNFMYKKTVAESSRNNLVFYLLLFFLSVKTGKKTLLEDLLENNIGKIEALNQKLSQFEKLERGQYADLVKDSGLSEVFQYDVFFILIIGFKNYKEIKNEFHLFFEKNEITSKEYARLHEIYGERLFRFFDRFEKNLIEDDRIGYTGEYLDLSKSVYRTIKMRSSRRIDLTLHKYAEVKKISSQSPIIVEIIQSIDPEIVSNIWEAYSLDNYVQDVWKLTSEKIIRNQFALGIVVGVAGNGVYDALKWLVWKVISGSTNRKEKNNAREEFKESLEKNRSQSNQDTIQEALAKSVMSSNEYLQNEVKELKEKLKLVRKESDILIDQSKKIKELEDKIEKLENVEVEVNEISET